MATVGEVLPQYLEAFGITHVFGIPGVHNVELFRGLPQSRLTYVAPRHEQGAGFMADGFARVAGRPAACFTITGPGLTNILTAMGQAYGDSVPMLVISSNNERASLGQPCGLLHELRSQGSMAADVSALSQVILDPGQIFDTLARASALLASARPRPIYLEFPLDVLAMPAPTGTFVRPPTASPGPAPGTIREAVKLLSSAQRPVAIFGGGAASAAAEAREVAERFAMPTILTVNARGILPPDHPFLAGSNLAAPAIRELIASADAVIAVGTELGETEMAPLPLPVPINGQFIRIDIDPEQLAVPAADVAIVSDARLALRAILDAVPALRPTRDGTARASATRQQLGASMPAAYAPFQALFQQIDEALGDFIVMGDSTKPVYAATEFLQMREPRRFYSASTGFGTLGYALPAGIGASLANPHIPTVVVVGDGGLQFSPAELAVAVAHRLPVVVIVWNNHGYAEIREAMLAKNITPVGVDYRSPDILALAGAFGCPAVRARHLDELGGILRGRPNEGPLVVLVDEADAGRVM